MSSCAPLVGLASGVGGAISGAISGARHSVLFAVVGGVLGMVIGIGSFFAVVLPYVLCMIQLENRPRLLKSWQYLFLPLMAVVLILAVLLSWLCGGLLM